MKWVLPFIMALVLFFGGCTEESANVTEVTNISQYEVSVENNELFFVYVEGDLKCFSADSNGSECVVEEYDKVKEDILTNS